MINKFCIEIPEIPVFSNEGNRLLIRMAQQDKKYIKLNSKNYDSSYTDIDENEFGITTGKPDFFSFQMKHYDNDFGNIKTFMAENKLDVNWNKVEPIFQKISHGIGPHIDVPSRKISLLYNLYGSATTTFYRKVKNWDNDMIFEKETVDAVFNIRMKMNTWYLFNNHEIHSVELDPHMNFRCGFVLNISRAVDDWDDAVSNWKKAFTNL
jgi:hypothetical protein